MQIYISFSAVYRNALSKLNVQVIPALGYDLAILNSKPAVMSRKYS